MNAELKRKLARAAAVLIVALGAGQLMQTMTGHGTKPRVAESETVAKAKDVEPLAGGLDPAEPKASLPETPATQTPRLPAADPLKAPDATTGSAEPAPALPGAAPTAPAVAEAPAAADPAKPVVAEAPAAPAVPPVAPEAPAVAVAKADPCAATLDLASSPNAMIALTLLSPCQPNQRIVVKHAGLAISGKTTATGAFFADIPALEVAAVVDVAFADGKKLSSTVEMPELADLRRFAVQWQADDVFQIHAFEDDTGYGGPGDVWAEAPHSPVPGLPAKGGFLTALGDASTDLPLLAEVYTYPADPLAAAPVVVVEAPVTQGSCGREILAETLVSTGGQVTVSDLSAAMPGCDAVGDYLVLKNLVADTAVATSN